MIVDFENDDEAILLKTKYVFDQYLSNKMMKDLSMNSH